MNDYLDSLETEARRAIAACDTIETIEAWRRTYLGPNGSVKDAIRYAVDLRPENRAEYAKRLDGLRDALCVRMYEARHRIIAATSEQLIPA